MRVLLATGNKGKQRELQAVLEGFGLDLVGLEAFPGLPEPGEDQPTFLGNARLKALYYLRRTGLPSVADDSGLMVDALGGWPGVYSARIADSDPARIEAVLNRLSEVDSAGRGAQFVCALCFALSEDRCLDVEAVVRGEITARPRGSGGFGYDPIFLYPAAGLTFAELTPAEKNRVSHRALALLRLREQLPAWLRG